MVLLDSEGTGSVNCEGYDDNQIFTLTVLLASVLIYNSLGVPERGDLEGLKYPLKGTVSRLCAHASVICFFFKRQ